MQSLPLNERFNDFMSRIGDLAMLNVIWLVCCIPVVTIGASTAALFEIIRSMREGHDAHILRRFIAALPRRFAANLLMTMLYLVFLTLTFFDLWYLSKYMGGTSLGAIAYGSVSAISIVLLIGSCFVFPVASRSRLSVQAQIVQSFAVSIRHPGVAGAMGLMVALPVVIAVIVPGGLPFVVFFWGLLFSGASAWLGVALMVRSDIITDSIPKATPSEPAA